MKQVCAFSLIVILALGISDSAFGQTRPDYHKSNINKNPNHCDSTNCIFIQLTPESNSICFKKDTALKQLNYKIMGIAEAGLGKREMKIYIEKNIFRLGTIVTLTEENIKDQIKAIAVIRRYQLTCIIARSGDDKDTWVNLQLNYEKK